MPSTITTRSHGLGYWERHARRYDRATYVLSRGPVARMLEFAVDAARGKRHVLEVAAGTGLTDWRSRPDTRDGGVTGRTRWASRRTGA